ncbi:MAG: hypothetical protein A2096_06630 [Spirochaetes bacterium GWF1_41_5]|nr:MAG: hypothetical protein A2096_06630 [Spirochaetes bacterium GWF1_41_5]
MFSVRKADAKRAEAFRNTTGWRYQSKNISIALSEGNGLLSCCSMRIFMVWARLCSMTTYCKKNLLRPF